MRLSLVTLVVPDYDEAIAFWCGKVGFTLVEDSPLGDGKRWVRVMPSGGGTGFLLAKAADPAQTAAIGNQTGGRVGFFIETDDFNRDHGAMLATGVRFLEAPRHEAYGIVAVFSDHCGNHFDLIEPAKAG